MVKGAMDLGCLDLGCLSSVSGKKSGVLDLSSPSRSGKNKSPRETSAIRKSQSKRSSQRKTSPLGWFPRRKGDSYLNRKIKKLQEVDGMNQTLDETLGNSNPHYCKIVREQIAVKEAAGKAMELRKAALVEASWCRILRAARITSLEAETLMENAEKAAVEAFEMASAMGVIMHDKPTNSRKQCRIEISRAHGSSTHTITTSFETAFDVDKEVAAVVKTAFTRLANCQSLSKPEFKDLLKKISENPDVLDNHEITEMSSECDTESDSELGTLHKVDEEVAECEETSYFRMRNLKVKRRQSFGKFRREKLEDMMLERLQGLQEDQLSSLASVIATCGLNEALAEVRNLRVQKTSTEPTLPDHGNFPSVDTTRSRRNSKFGTLMEGKTTTDGSTEIPSLDKYLVKNMSKLEREVREAKMASKDISEQNKKVHQGIGSDPVPDLGSILVKHSSRLEKEIEEAKKNAGVNSEKYQQKSSRNKTPLEPVPNLESLLVKKNVSGLEKKIQETKRHCGKMYENVKKPGEKDSLSEVRSLDSCLVKHVSMLEKVVQEAKKRSQEYPEVRNLKTVSSVLTGELGKENAGSYTNKAVNQEERLDKILVKPVHKLETEKYTSEAVHGNQRIQKRKQAAKTDSDYESLDKILVKRVPKLEKEKLRFKDGLEEQEKVKKNVEGCLNHGPENMKMAKLIPTRQEVRDREIQETWGGLGLGESKNNTQKRPEIQKTEITENMKMAKLIPTRQEVRDREIQETWGGLGLGESKNNTQKRPEIQKTEITEHLGEEVRPVLTRRQERDKEMLEAWGGLGLGDSGLYQTVNKHKRKSETEKMEAATPFLTSRQRRDREIQEAWGGLDLGNSIRPSLSKLEREKAAWIKAEKEQTS